MSSGPGYGSIFICPLGSGFAVDTHGASGGHCPRSIGVSPNPCLLSTSYLGVVPSDIAVSLRELGSQGVNSMTAPPDPPSGP